jgi:hypothetical protein
MPKGMFLLIHDEIKGPQIKCSYFTTPIPLPQEFISKLYMSHAGFQSTSHLEIKFGRYSCVSCFTGDLDRTTKKEGILGILFEEDEDFENLDLFLNRSLYQAISKPDDQMIEIMFSRNLKNYLQLLNFFEKVEIEKVEGIFLLTGRDFFRSVLFKTGDMIFSDAKMNEIYQLMVDNQIIPHYYYTDLNLNNGDNVFLAFKAEKKSSNIRKILPVLKWYLEKYVYYAPEILSLFLFPSLIKVKSITSDSLKKSVADDRILLRYLKKSENYNKAFHSTIAKVISGRYYISPEL